jgi:hypothetical protein
MLHKKNEKYKLPPRPEWQKEERRRQRQYISSIVVFIFVLLIGFLIWQSRYSVIREIKVVRSQPGIDSDHLISETEVRHIVQNRFSDKFLLFFHHNTFLTVQSQKIKNSLLSDPRLRSVRIKKQWPGQLVIGFSEKQPAVKLSILGDKDYYLDSGGRLIAPVSDILRHSDLPTIYDKTESNWQDPETTQTLKIALNLLQGNSELNGFIKFTIIEINQDVGVLQIIAITDEGWKAYFAPQEGMEAQIDNLKLILESRLAKEQREGVEYVDLRFGNRVYYK